MKLSPKVLWSNAGNYFENLLNLMAKAGMPAERLAPGRLLLETKTRPDGTRNPLQPVQYLPINDEHGQAACAASVRSAACATCCPSSSYAATVRLRSSHPASGFVPEGHMGI